MAPPRCPVCQRGRAGQHFSGMCCRACAAFFKRRVCEGRAKPCRVASHASEVNDLDIRCKPCRFGRCLKNGLRIEDVNCTPTAEREKEKGTTETNPVPATVSEVATLPVEQAAFLAPPPVDLPRPVPTHSRSPDSVIFETQPSTIRTRTNPDAYMLPHIPQQHFEVDGISTPVLYRLCNGYRKLTAMKRSIHAFNEHIIFQECTKMRPTTVKQYNDLMHTYVSLTHDVLTESFQPYNSLPADEKLTIFRRTFAQLHLLEDGYRTALYFPDADDQRMAANYATFIDGEHFADFFPDEKDQEKAIAAMKNLMTKIRKVLVRSCVELQLTEVEVAALYAVLIWTEACTSMADPSIAYTARDAVFKDLQTLYSRSLDHARLAVRFGRLLSLVVDIHDLVMVISEATSYMRIFNFPFVKLEALQVAAE